MVSHIFLHQKEMSSMHSQNSGIRMMNSNTSDIAFGNLPSHMEVSTVPSHYFGLSTIRELCITNFANKAILLSSSKEEVGSIFGVIGLLISLHFDVSGQQTNFSSHNEFFPIIGLNLCKVFVFKFFNHSNGHSVLRNAFYFHVLCFIVVKGR